MFNRRLSEKTTTTVQFIAFAVCCGVNAPAVGKFQATSATLVIVNLGRDAYAWLS